MLGPSRRKFNHARPHAEMNQTVPKPVFIGQPITIEQLWAVAHDDAEVALDQDARKRVLAARVPIDELVAQGDSAPAVYGINTGFGALAETRINASDIRALQRNLVRSHACGIGPDLSLAQVRGMLLLRAQVIGLGHSGVRVDVVERLVEMLNRQVCPRIPSQGSVGASGDLAPLAHLALTLIGEGEADFCGERMSSKEALLNAQLQPLELAAKEGLALINGTQYMSSLGALALYRARDLCRLADIAGAVSIEALLCSRVPFDERLMQVRPHPGQARVAKNMRLLLAESELMKSHHDCDKVQDPYSLRCIPQVHGASRDALAWSWQVVERELNSVTDNPTVFLGASGADVVSGGNFHGQPIAFALDLAGMAVAELANISERRVEQLVNPALSTGLTPFLASNSGICSGYMIAQVASAALVSENKVLAHPASVDSIPSSANREDHVSMGSIAARKLCQIVDNVEMSLAIELLAALNGIDQRAPVEPSPVIAQVRELVRKDVPPLTEDRPLYRDFEIMRERIRDGSVLRVVREAVAELD